MSPSTAVIRPSTPVYKKQTAIAEKDLRIQNSDSTEPTRTSREEGKKCTMVASINCSLKAPPPPPPATTTGTTKTSLSPWPVRKDLSWGRRSMTAAAAACVVLGITGVESCCNAITAEEVSAPVSVTAVGATRWSDRRMCPSWNTNSLESIVPENLPRPSGRRRIETVSVDRNRTSGPVVVLRHNSSCFSL